MNSTDYSRLARKYAERAPTSRPLKLNEPEPLLAVARRFGTPINTPNAHQPLVLVRSNIDGRIFAVGESDEGPRVVEVER